MSSTSQYVSGPKSPLARLTAANANRDGTGTIVDLYTPGASGGRIDDIAIKAEGVTTAGMIRFYHHDGANYRLLREVNVGAVVAPSATVQTFEALLAELGWCIQSGHKIAASTHNAEVFILNVTRGGDF